MSDYPEHDKLKAIDERCRQTIGDWLDHGPYVIAQWGCPHGATERLPDVEEWDHPYTRWRCTQSSCREGRNDARLWPVHKSVQVLMAEMFDIDLDRLEAEKQAMLDQLRAMQP